MAEDSSDKPSGAQDCSLGSSKDVLFGWLVRRAAADLGLAEAIAASEAQRTEQIKRLEETLLAEIQDLRSQRGGAAAPAQAEPAMDEIKARMETLATRLGKLESAAQETGQTSAALKAELAAWGNRVADQRAHLDARYSGIESIAGTLSAKVRDLEQRLGAQPPEAEHLRSALDELQSQVQSLAERTARLDAAGPTPTAAEREAERMRWTAEIEERSVARIRELGDEIREKLKGFSLLKSDLEAGASAAAALSERVAAVERGMRQCSAELKAEIGAVAAEQHRHQAGAALLKELDQRFGARLGDLENSLREKSSALDARLGALAGQWREQSRADENRGAELKRFGSELRGLAERLDKAEFTAQQALDAATAEKQLAEHAAGRVAEDLASLKAEWAGQLGNLAAPQALVEGLEKNVSLKFDILRNELARSRQDAETRAEQLREIGRDLQALAQRLVETESVAHRAHALMVNESQQGAQLRDELRAELDRLREQWNRAPASDAMIRGIEENLNLKIGEMESRLVQGMRLLDYRESEIRELQSRVQSLSEGSSRAAAPAVAIPVDINMLRARREESVADGSAAAEGSAPSAPGDWHADAPAAASGGGNKEQLRQLQERISADIERARAELREKSGRWKVRR